MKRYDLEGYGDAEMVPNETGDYVSWEDVVTFIAVIAGRPMGEDDLLREAKKCS